MRRVIVTEGYRTADDEVIREGALYVEEPIIPVRDTTGKLIGLADEFERDDGGAISFEIDLLAGDESVVGLVPMVEVNPVVTFNRQDGVTVIEGGRIREVLYR